MIVSAIRSLKRGEQPLCDKIAKLTGIKKEKLLQIQNIIIKVIVLLAMLLCLWESPGAVVLVIVLGKFILDLEDRVAILEQQLEEEKRRRFERYDTQRYV